MLLRKFQSSSETSIVMTDDPDLDNIFFFHKPKQNLAYSVLEL